MLQKRIPPMKQPIQRRQLLIGLTLTPKWRARSDTSSTLVTKATEQLLSRQHGPRIAHAPAIGFHQRQEALHRFVEQRRLFQIEHMPRLGKEREPGRRKMFLQKKTRLDAGIVLVATLRLNGRFVRSR
jgi:hypothetical protein